MSFLLNYLLCLLLNAFPLIDSEEKKTKVLDALRPFVKVVKRIHPGVDTPQIYFTCYNLVKYFQNLNTFSSFDDFLSILTKNVNIISTNVNTNFDFYTPIEKFDSINYEINTLQEMHVFFKDIDLDASDAFNDVFV